MSAEFAMQVGPVGFRLRSDWAGPMRQMRALYASYPAPIDAIACATARIEATRPWRRWLRPSVQIRGDYTIPDALPLPLSQGVLAAEMAMNLQVALGWRQHLLLHASAVERNGHAVIMVGASGSGKSTLAAMLGEGLSRADGRNGWRLLGDEFAFIGLDDGAVWPFPRLISLKNESIGVMAAHVPPARLGPVITGTPKGTIRHLVPRDDAIARMHELATASLLLFPAFGAPAGVHAIAPADAFMRLTDSSTNYVALGEPGFAALSRLVRDVPAVGIGYGNGAEGLAAVEALCAELGI